MAVHDVEMEGIRPGHLGPPGLVGKMADAVIEGKAMYKEEDREESTAVYTPADRVASGAQPRFEEEVELEDEELLGASTLARC